MSPQIEFQRGQFRNYRAIVKVHIGKYAMDLAERDEFSFDGTTVRYGGTEYDIPSLKGQLGSWFVPVTDTTTQYRSKPAGVQVRPATPEGESRGESFSMSNDEDEVIAGTMKEAQQIRKAASSGDAQRLNELRTQRREEAARRQGVFQDPMADSNPNAPPPQNAADVDPEIEAALMDEAEQQYVRARPVHDGTPHNVSASEAEMRAVQEANRRNQEMIARKTAELERVDPRKTRDEMGGTRHDAPDAGGQRVGRGGKYSVIRDEQDDGIPVGHYQFSQGATVGNAEDARTAASSKPTDVTRVASQQPVQVGNAVAQTPMNRRAGAHFVDDMEGGRRPQAVGALNTTQVRRGDGNVGIDEIGPHGTMGDVDEARSGDELEDLLPDALVAGRRSQPPPRLSETDEIAEITAAWSTKRNWQKRVAEAVEFYADWPEALEAIYAIESDSVVKQIKAQLPEKG